VYLHLEKPSAPEPVQYYGSVAPGLYHAILNRCVDIDRMCMDEMMAIDATGGLGVDAPALVDRARGDLRGRPHVPSAVCEAGDPAPILALRAP
jgi:cytochrome o ubiquinol oxidase subunit 2